MRRFPTLHNLDKLSDVTQQDSGKDLHHLSGADRGSSLDRMVSIAEQDQRGLFFIFVSKEISASDYKRLVRSGADWVSWAGAPQEIADIIFQRSRQRRSAGDAWRPGAKPRLRLLLRAVVASATLRLRWRLPS